MRLVFTYGATPHPTNPQVEAPKNATSVNSGPIKPYPKAVTATYRIEVANDTVTLDLSQPSFSIEAACRIEDEQEVVDASVLFDMNEQYEGDVVFCDAVTETELGRMPFTSAYDSTTDSAQAKVTWIPNYATSQNKLDDLGVTMVSVHIEPSNWSGNSQKASMHSPHPGPTPSQKWSYPERTT